MEQTLKSMEQMMLQLMEDWHKWEEEFATECAGWEKAAEQWIKTMQAQTGALMALVCDSHKAESLTVKPLTGMPQVKLMQLMDQDDIEAYLVTFERIMQARGTVDLIFGIAALCKGSTSICCSALQWIQSLWGSEGCLFAEVQCLWGDI